ncbi:ROK family transcriptional regulator [Caldifermentibacillus hisashii]|uniref:ROK family transcriptional regulator n=1 Tax=Caldifermentibacillus hisashii TaxID=996558 RepID=UPI0031FCF473
MNKPRKASRQLVKSLNRELVINELKEFPKQSRADLSKRTKLSKPAVSEIVKELIEEGLVIEIGLGPSSGGKKPILLEYNSKANYVLGVLVEDDKIFITVGDMNGELVDITQLTFTPPTEGSMIVSLIENGVRKILNSQKIKIDKVLGMTVGISGISVDPNQKIDYSPSIDWGDINLKDMLSKKLDMQIIIENDVNLMTIGEYYKGSGFNIPNLVYLFIGNGIGSGIIINGQFYKGSHTAAGEIGYMFIGNESNFRQNMGIFEATYGRFGISEMLKQEYLEFKQDDSLIQVMQAHDHNLKIKEILNEVIKEWAKAAVNIISILDPEMVILSGELEYMNEESFNLFKSIVENYVPKLPDLKITKLGSKAGLYGAVHLALNHFKQPALNIN